MNQGFKVFMSLIMVASSSLAADSFMTDEEITTLIGTGKTINLGGSGEGYEGSLNVKADGSALGSVKIEGGKVIAINGAWLVKQNSFCRKWAGLDNDKEICEKWKKIGDKRVEVQSNEKKIGVNWW